jgi:hypothetical protein
MSHVYECALEHQKWIIFPPFVIPRLSGDIISGMCILGEYGVSEQIKEIKENKRPQIWNDLLFLIV